MCSIRSFLSFLCVGRALIYFIGKIVTHVILCSVRLIHEVVSKFDSKEIELVKSTCFEGMLLFPPIKQINRKFAL